MFVTFGEGLGKDKSIRDASVVMTIQVQLYPWAFSAVKGCVARRGERADVHPCKQPCAGMWGIPAHSFRLKRQKKDKHESP